MATKGTKYFVLQTLWHDGEKRHVAPGEIVTLDHLAPEQIEKLTAGNVITPDMAASSRSIAGSAAPDAPAAAKK